LAGKEVYKQHCQDCHGATGRGELAMMPNFSRGEGIMKTDREMYRLILQGKGIMPGYEGVLPDEDVDNVIAYLKTFL
ncbi:MAG: cytochrome c, partial [Gammaproteobacteria bacterium]|nr:cytochrome c [Gammaproteobacteria bacterium]